MEEEEQRWAKPASGRSTIMSLAIVVLLGLVGWLLAERNARQYALVYEDGVLSVKRGILFPVGRQTFKTDDPNLAEAYAPLRPPPGAKLDDERVFDDRSGLDQALYEILARWARDDISSERGERVEEALTLLSRAEKLAGISAAQREDLRNLRAESGFFEARQLLERSADALRQARERLRLTSDSSSPHAGDAGETLRRIDPLVDELYQASRMLSPGGTDRAAGGVAPPAQAPPAPAPPPSGKSP